MLVLLLAVGHFLLWGGALALSRHAPTLDSAEQLAWSYALEAGYWKHPPLPTWLLHALVAIFGRSVALPVLASQACVAIALALGWRLGSVVLGPRDSLVAMALTSLVTYYNLGAEPFNHNTVLLPFQAGTVLLFFLAVRRGRWWHWAGMGACAGFAMLVKYVALFPLAALLVYLLLDRTTWNRNTVRGLALAAGMFLFVWGPHAMWLQEHDFLPLQYAQSVAVRDPDTGSLLRGLGDFLTEQAVKLLPLLAVLAWLLRPASAHGILPARAEPRDRLFLWVAGLAPLVMLLLYGLGSGTHLIPRWGTNLFLLSGWLALDLLRQWRTPLLGPSLRTVAKVQLSMCLLFTLIIPLVEDALAIRGRTEFPGVALHEAVHRTWRSHTAAPLRLVITDAWTGGNLEAHQIEPLAVFLDGEYQQAPWVSPSDIADCGALVLLNRTEFEMGHAPPNLLTRIGQAPLRGEWTLLWPTRFEQPGAGLGVRISWGVILPVPGGRCAL